MYWSSNAYNQQYDLYFYDSRYKTRPDLFVAIIYSLRKKVTARYTFQYADLTKEFQRYTEMFPPHKVFEKKILLTKFLDYLALNDPLAIILYRMLMKKENRQFFGVFVVNYLKKNNQYNIGKVKLDKMYQLFWHLSCPLQDATGFKHAEAIATYNLVTLRELELGSFFDFMDEYIEE